MPRRALVLVTALVLALHGLVLKVVPLAWESPLQPGAGRVFFSTRSVVVAPPPAPGSVPAAEAPAAAPPAARAPKQPPPRKEPVVPAREGTPVLERPATEEPAAPPTQAPAQAAGAVAAGDPAATTAQEAADPGALNAATPVAPNQAAPPAQVASAPSDEAANTTSAGIDISAPGADAGSGANAPPLPVRIPAPTRLAFDVNGQAKKFAYSARAELLWQHDGSRYEARQEVSAFLMGSRTQRSVGAITAQGLQPERFSDKSRSEQAAHFDHAKGRVTFSANTPEAAVGPGGQDRLSMFIQLGALLAADPGRFTPGTKVTITTVSARTADRWTFTVEGPELLDLPAGPTPALKLQRLPRKDYDQKAELWVAPTLNYLPVRIKLTQANGDFADLQLRNSTPP